MYYTLEQKKRKKLYIEDFEIAHSDPKGED